MRKLVISVVSITVVIGGVIGGIVTYTAAPSPAQEPATAPTAPTPDPASHNVYDADLAKKFVLYHELAAQLDAHAAEYAAEPEIRAYATQQHTYNVAQVGRYVSILQSWNETYSRLDDFPKVAGSSCGSYPTFPGMLPHAEVNAFLQTNSEGVDQQYLRLVTQHHREIDTTITANEEFAHNGELAELRKTFLNLRNDEMRQMKLMQTQLLDV